EIIDQTRLPHELVTVALTGIEAAGRAIRTMQVRGAPLIGATAAYGLAMALREKADDEALAQAVDFLAAQRPTAVNLRWALEEVHKTVATLPPSVRAEAAFAKAAGICEDDVASCRRIGEHGAALIREIAARKPKGAPV